MSDSTDPHADPFRPPAVSTLVHCLHCGQEYESYLIEWRIESGASGQPMGFWCCPVPGCSGCGFGFDLLPVDPEYRDENGGWIGVDDEEDELEDELEECGLDEIDGDDPAGDELPF